MHYTLSFARSAMFTLILASGVSSAPLFAQGPPAVLAESRTIKAVEHWNYRVVQGGTLTVVGMLYGDLAVEKGGQAIIRGIVNGNVVNLGGDLKVYGHVTGSVTKRGGNTLIDPTAPIDGGIHF